MIDKRFYLIYALQVEVAASVNGVGAIGKTPARRSAIPGVGILSSCSSVSGRTASRPRSARPHLPRPSAERGRDLRDEAVEVPPQLGQGAEEAGDEEYIDPGRAELSELLADLIWRAG